MTIIPVILSGGAGSRLWPLSFGDHPKQFLPLVSERTMIQETLLRLEGIETDSPIVSCNESHRFLVAQQIGEVSAKKPVVILEPVARNTAPAIAAACFAAMQRANDAVVVVLPSDHVIKDKTAFQNAVVTAAKEAMNGSLVTFGIVPTFAATGYGYVKAGTAAGDVYALEKFVEKPCLEKAQEYIASGEYSWNSGMFVFKAETFVSELEKFAPEMYKHAKTSFENAAVDADFIRLNKADFEQIKGDSIDYAVMEKTSLGKVVKLNAGWDDVGSWSALWDISAKDKDGNVSKNKSINLKTKDCYINASKMVATIGVENLVIVESDDSILVANKDCVQDVKLVVEELKK